ncbi:MAG: metallophosphoesterase [Bacteroidota bacterium]
MKSLLLSFCIYLFPVHLFAQVARIDSIPVTSIDFISDTQQPLEIEKIYRKQNHNLQATAMIFSAILQNKPAALLMLGDIVSLGYNNRKWRRVDKFLDSARREGIKVYGLLGNHDVMARDRRGENNFDKRFPEHLRTGYVKTIDSISIVLLNSNFNKLSAEQVARQQQWYIKTLDSLDKYPGVKGIIVSAHHPIFTNSSAVKPSDGLRQYFLPAFMSTKKCVLFITGHAHAFEHFKYQNKNFLVIGGGGGLHQPLEKRAGMPADAALTYKPLFHYLNIKRYGNLLQLTSYFLQPDFSGFAAGYSFAINLP